MECGRDKSALPREDDLALELADRLASPPGPSDFRRAYEHAPEGRVEDGNVDLSLERFPLPPEGIPVHRHVHEPKEAGLRLRDRVVPLLREEDAPRARPEDRHPVLRPADNLVEQPELHEQLRYRRALPAGDREGVDLCEVRGSADGEGVTGDAGFLHRPRCRVHMLADVSLDADNAD